MSSRFLTSVILMIELPLDDMWWSAGKAYLGLILGLKP
jgi:hypothetical protein